MNLAKLAPGGESSLLHRHSKQLVNRTLNDVVYLEVGDRTPGDEGTYPNDDLKAALDADGKWQYTHKDGQPY